MYTPTICEPSHCFSITSRMFSSSLLPSSDGSAADQLHLQSAEADEARCLITHGLTMLMYSGARAQMIVLSRSSAKILLET